MNYINNIPLLNDDNDDLFKSLIPSMDNFIDTISTINNDTDSSYSCDPYTSDFHTGHVNINYLIKELRCNKELNVFFFDYNNYSIDENIQPYSVWTPYGSQEREMDIAYSIPFSYTHYSGQRITTRLNVALNKRKCFLDLNNSGYVFNIKKDNPSFEIRFPYKDAVDKRDFSITPNIKNDFYLSKKYNGIIIKATTVNDFLAVCYRVGNGEFALRKISEKYTEAIKQEKDGSELNYLYSNLPPVILQYLKRTISIPVDTLINHLYKLVDYDDTGWLSGWVDSSSALLNLLQIIGDSTILYNLFKLNPKLVKRIYYNLDGKILHNGRYVRSRTVFADIIGILSRANNCEDPDTQRILFRIGEHHRVLSNQITNDSMDHAYDLTQQSRKTKTVTQNFHGGGGDGSAGNHRITYEKPMAWETENFQNLQPLDLVYFIDESWEDSTPRLVPVIYVKSMSDKEEWEDIHLSIRIAANILAVVLGVASLGATSPLIVALGVVDIGLATTDILVAVSEDALMKTPEGEEFINTWNTIALGGGIASAGPLLIRGAFRVTGKLFSKATNPKTIAFLQDSVQNLLQRAQNLPDFRHNSVEIIFDILEEFRHFELPKLPNRLENLRQLGVLFIKGDVKIGGVFKKEYVLIFEGEIIARGNLKEIIRSINYISKNAGDNLEGFLKSIISILDYKTAKNLLTEDFISALKQFGKSEKEVVDFFLDYHNSDSLRFFNEVNHLINKYTNLTRSDVLILWGYTCNLFYKEFNHFVRSGINTIKTKPIKEMLLSALKKTPIYNGNAYRAIDIKGDLLKKFLTDHQIGKKVTYNEFLSCGSVRKGSFFNKNSKNIRIEILNVKNAHIISEFSDGIRFRGYLKEELLLLPGQIFEVLDVSYKKGIYNIILIHL